jgi:hypothetical protein
MNPHPPYVCMACGLRNDEPPWDRVLETKKGALYVVRCNQCLGMSPTEKETGMSMTRKHYTAIAEAVAETVLDPDERAALANRLAEIFKDDNVLFNRILFVNAADAVRVKEE